MSDTDVDPYDPLVYVHQPWVRYTVLSGTYVSIGEQVRNHLAIGWIPQGGVCVFGEPGKALFYQAMYHPEG